MNIRCNFLIFLLIFYIKFINVYGAVTETIEENARQYLKNANIRIFNAFESFQDYQFQTDLEDNDEIFHRLMIAMKTVVDAAKYIKQFPYENFNDIELKREIKSLIDASGLFVLDDNDLIELHNSLERLRKLATLRNICPYKRLASECDFSYIPDLLNVISQSNDPQELQFYWTVWRRKTSLEAPNDFEKVIEMYKKAASLNGM